MKIARFLDPRGSVRMGSPLDAEHARVLAGQIDQGFIETAETARVVRWLAPIVPTNIFGIGLNYRAHAAETGARIPETPVVFMKPTTAITDPGSPIRIPRACDRGPEVDYEAELAVVIGRAARDVPIESALSHVLGYCCANDVSARRWQKERGAGQWVRGKSFDSFCPLGPTLVSADAIPDPQDLRLTCTLNGEVVQRGHTGDMIFSVAELIAFLSRDTTLLPGTLIITGTPPGVGMARKPPRFLRAGDQVTVEIEGIGALTNPVVEASAESTRTG
jgi:2-keto-4-pentenoate hydratase/2-oxohepta-3-ene-1,7-dioic acid hydratase in catechol pathway